MAQVERLIPEGYCLRCRGCCRFSSDEGPWLPHTLAEERAALGELRIVACDGAGDCLFRCCHLDPAGNTCGVYDRRPFECRLYPFVLNARDGRRYLSVDTNCPFIAERLGSEELKAYGVRLRHSLQTEWKGMLAANPQVFQRYPDVTDVAELTV